MGEVRAQRVNVSRKMTLRNVLLILVTFLLASRETLELDTGTRSGLGRELGILLLRSLICPLAHFKQVLVRPLTRYRWRATCVPPFGSASHRTQSKTLASHSRRILHWRELCWFRNETQDRKAPVHTHKKAGSADQITLYTHTTA